MHNMSDMNPCHIYPKYAFPTLLIQDAEQCRRCGPRSPAPAQRKSGEPRLAKRSTRRQRAGAGPVPEQRTDSDSRSASAAG